MSAALSQATTPMLWPATGGWCATARQDPITGLVAFPDFHEQFPDLLVGAIERGAYVGLAIGDVDRLKEYVENTNTQDPASFGHLAGNALMTHLGLITRTWFAQTGFARGCVSTFGGDEVIIAAEATSEVGFHTQIRTLRDRLRNELPRSVSFAFAVLDPTAQIPEPGTSDQPSQRYLRLVSGVDRCLFAGKAARGTNGLSNGFLINTRTYEGELR